MPIAPPPAAVPVQTVRHRPGCGGGGRGGVNSALNKGVAKVLICYDRHRDGRNGNTRMMARRNDHPSAALPQLSRYRYCPPWEDPSRQATLLLPREALCGSHLPAGVFLYWAIA